MSLSQDFRSTLRSWKAKPGLIGIALLSLVLGIGANTAVFSLISALILEPLPYAEPDRLVRLWETFAYPGGRGQGTVSVANFLDWSEQNQVFEGIGAYTFVSLNLRTKEAPLRLSAVRMTRNLFGLLGTPAARGRTFTQEDLAEDGQVAVLSDGLWTRDFGSDPQIVGREITLDGAAYTVLGVMPPEFRFPARSNLEIWVPRDFTENEKSNRGNHSMATLARLKPGVGLERARSEMETIAKRLEQQYPGTQEDRGILILPLVETVQGDSRLTLAALWGAAMLVLLISCANVANLLLARTASRQREFAIRAALGAGRTRLIRQVLVESFSLSLTGGALALAAGYFVIRWLSRLPGSTIPSNSPVGIDLRVLGFSLAAALLASLLCGLIPALRVSRGDFNLALRDRQSLGIRRDRWRSGLVIAETALSLVVLIGAGLMLKSLYQLTQVDPGLEAKNRLTFRISLTGEKYQEQAQIVSFFDRLLEQARHLPGVSQVGMINLLPVQNWGFNGNFYIEGRVVDSVRDQPFSEYRIVTPDFFSTLGIPLLSGRFLSDTDRKDSPPVVLINEALASRHWPDQDPVGTRLTWASHPEEGDWLTVVGVVANTRSAGLGRDPIPEMYLPFALAPTGTMSLVVHSQLPEASLLPALRGILHDLDPEQPIYLVRTMSEVIRDSVARQRFRALLYSIFAGLALTMAVAGVYGVLSYLVTQREQEIGIRMALGANSRAVMGLFGKEALILTGIGAVMGLLGAWALTRFIASQLYQISATDPLVFVAIPLLLVGVGLAAAMLPARKASRIDPLEALRQEL